MTDDSESPIWKWAGRLWMLKEILSSAGVIGIVAGVWAHMRQMPAPISAVLAFATFAISVTLAVEIRRWRTLSSSKPELSNHQGAPPIGSRSEEYAVEQARRFQEAYERVAESERQTVERLKAIEKERAELVQKHEVSQQSNVKWSKIYDDMFKMFKDATRARMAASQAIVAIEDALTYKATGGLFSPRITPAVEKLRADAQRIGDAQRIIKKYNDDLIFADFPGIEEEPSDKDPTDPANAPRTITLADLLSRYKKGRDDSA